jgi:formylglycine-generating enzyme required for sulfatase activity
MHGNVWEWCADGYGDYPNRAATDSPAEAEEGSVRVYRGGGWSSFAAFCRSAFRGSYAPGNRNFFVGFRPAAVPVAVEKASNSEKSKDKVAAEPITPQPSVVANQPSERQRAVPLAMGGTKAGEEREFAGTMMVWCPPTGPEGFKMGSPEDEEGRGDYETQHTVVLTKGFWLAKTECTQGQWESVTGENSSDFTGTDHPVENVSWDDVQGYLAKMNTQKVLPSGWKWDLPSEAQWEYACRAGTETAFAGDPGEMAWHFHNSGGKTNPVVTKKANAWGLHDLHGNVLEWCSDWYGDHDVASATDPTGPETGLSRVTRGGGWFFYAGHCRSASRREYSPDERYEYLGFRVAAVPAGRREATE